MDFGYIIDAQSKIGFFTSNRTGGDGFDDIYKFKGNTLYLQPNNNEENLRVFLNENNFKIQKELLVKDDKIIYSILVISPDEEKQVLSNEEIIFGLPIEEIELFKEKWNEELNHLI